MKFSLRTYYSPLVIVIVAVILCASISYSQMPSFTTQNEKHVTRWNLQYTLAQYHHNLKKAEAQILITIPLSKKTPVPYAYSEFTGQTAYLSKTSPDQEELFSSTLSIGIPFLDGLAFLDYGENTTLQIESFISNASLTIDTTIESKGAINLHAFHSSDFSLDQYWNTLRMGYILQSSTHTQMGFTLNRHWFGIQANGNYIGALEGTLSRTTPLSSMTYNLNYSDNQYQGSLNGSYSGTGWSPEISIKYGPVRLEAKFATEITLTGNTSINHTTPYLIDALTLNPTDTIIDSLLSDKSLDQASRGATHSTVYETKSPLSFSTPHFYTLEVELLDSTLFMSYTKTFGSFSLVAAQDSLDKATAADIRKHLTFKGYIDHLTMIQAAFTYGYGAAGFLIMNNLPVAQANLFNYYKEGNVLDKVTTAVFVPILYGGLLVGSSVQFEVQLHVAPMVSLKLGVRYVF
ncbi:MAG: hypothetical protein OCD01_02935 [Fibrobacterales bacterium]